MIILAPVLGRLTDKIGGKYILMTGLTLFAAGMGWAVLIATPHSAWYDFLAPMIVAGLGMGGTFPPMTTTAMRDVEPRMAGAASGVLNTTRQVGSVIGTAAVGALLQNRLVSSLTSQATSASAALPPQARGPFVNGFRQAASSGLIGGAPGRLRGPGGYLAGARGPAAPARRRGLRPGLRARDAVDHGPADRRGGPGRGQLPAAQEQGQRPGTRHGDGRGVRVRWPGPSARPAHPAHWARARAARRGRPRNAPGRTGTGPRTPAPGR